MHVIKPDKKNKKVELREWADEVIIQEENETEGPIENQMVVEFIFKWMTVPISTQGWKQVSFTS